MASGSRPTVDIRPACPGDADALALVGQATFLETFAGVLHGGGVVAHCMRAHGADAYARWIEGPRSAAWLATVEPGGAPVGYALMAPADLPVPDPHPEDVELKRIYLLSRFHGGGHGRRLLDTALEYAHRMRAPRVLLGVYAGNADAQAFYARAGFEPVSRRSFDVGGVEYDDVIMAWRLHA